jgi:hypothetical protein
MWFEMPRVPGGSHQGKGRAEVEGAILLSRYTEDKFLQETGCE